MTKKQKKTLAAELRVIAEGLENRGAYLRWRVSRFMASKGPGIERKGREAAMILLTLAIKHSTAIGELRILADQLDSAPK